MKKPTAYFFIVCCLLLFNVSAHAQCGVVAGIDFQSSYPPQADLMPDASYQPGWVPYKYQWVINNDTIISSSGWQTTAPLPEGPNRIDLTIWATDTVTQDSCQSTYGNVYWSMGNTLLATLDIQNVNGLTVDFSGDWIGNMQTPFIINYGDGTCDTSFMGAYFTHTYPAPGDYGVEFRVEYAMSNMTISYAQAFRTVHLGAAAVNYSNGSIYPAAVSCDSMSFQAQTYPAFTTAYGDFSYGPTWLSVPTFSVFDSYGYYKHFDVPGQHIAHVNVHDSATFGEYHLYKSFTLNGCNVAPDTISGYVYYDTNNDGLHTANEPPVIHGQVGCGGYYDYNYRAYTDSSGYYELPVPHDEVYVRNVFTNYIPGKYSINVNTGSMHTGYNFLQKTSVVYPITVSGRVYVDMNNDTVFNTPDRYDLFNQVKIVDNNTGQAIYVSANNGYYSAGLPAGSYVMTPIEYTIDNPSSYPDSIVINATTGNFTNQDFAVNSNYAGCNLRVTTMNYNIRPGFGGVACLAVRNTGIDSAKAIVILTYDSTLVVDSVLPSNGTINTVLHTITWQTPYMQVLSQGFYFAYIHPIATTTPLGTVYNFQGVATINGGAADHDMSNNIITGTITVIGSFDPNDKQVTPAGAGAAGNVLHQQRLFYRINFQNTGTATALRVAVQDTISPNLDLSTLMLEQSSHSCFTVINERAVTWFFNNIDLPDSNSNEPQSHGFIEFSILPIQGLPDGSPVENNASIYFDFNLPVLTNTVINTLQTNPTLVKKVETDERFLYLSPNPAKNNVTVYTGLKNSVVEIFNAQGNKVFSGEVQQNPFQINIRDYAQGIYLVKVTSEKQQKVKKLVVARD